MSQLEEYLSWQMKVADVLEPVKEHRFHPKRRWRFDFAWPDLMLAVEVEGHGGAKSRHTSFTGFQNDCTKYNEACLLGWRVLRFTGPMVKSGEALDTIERMLSILQPAQTG